MTYGNLSYNQGLVNYPHYFIAAIFCMEFYVCTPELELQREAAQPHFIHAICFALFGVGHFRIQWDFVIAAAARPYLIGNTCFAFDFSVGHFEYSGPCHRCRAFSFRGRCETLPSLLPCTALWVTHAMHTQCWNFGSSRTLPSLPCGSVLIECDTFCAFPVLYGCETHSSHFTYAVLQVALCSYGNGSGQSHKNVLLRAETGLYIYCLRICSGESVLCWPYGRTACLIFVKLAVCCHIFSKISKFARSLTVYKLAGNRCCKADLSVACFIADRLASQAEPVLSFVHKLVRFDSGLRP